MMSKGARVFVFLLVATLFNLLCTAILFFGLLFVYGLTLGRILVVKSSIFVILGAFILAVLGAGFAYKKILERLSLNSDFAARFGIDARKDSRKL